MSRRRLFALLAVPVCAVLAAALATPSSAAPSHQPVVSSISPSSGPTAGGTKIIIHGTHLARTRAVRIGGHAATHLHVKSSDTVTAVAPKDATGSYHVRVEAKDGTVSAPTRTDRYTYVHAPSVSHVQLANGNGRGGSTVVISGHHLSGATQVQFGSKSAAIKSVRGDTISATVPKHAPGFLHVTVSTAGGTSLKQADDVYPMPTPVSEQWTREPLADTERNNLAQITCPTPTQCIAIDHSDGVFTVDDGVWSDPVVLPPGLKSGALPDRISCPTTDFCVVVGRTHLFMLQGGTWTVGPDITDPSGGGVDGISCPTTDFCVLTQASSYRTYVDGTWSDPEAPPTEGGFTDVACYAADHCIASTGGSAYEFDGTTWTPMDGFPTPFYGGAQISCASSSLCAIVSDEDTAVTVWDGSSWSEVQQLAGGALWSYTDLNCIAATCFYETDAGTYVFANGSWTKTDDDSSYLLLGCATATHCIGEDDRGHIGAFDGTSWQATTVHLARAGGGTSLSCTSATFCALTDWAGNAFTFNGTVWSDPVNIADVARKVAAVSCAKPTFCLATFADLSVASYDGTEWSAEAPTLRPETSLQCFSARLCLATGNHDTEQFDGNSWTVVATGGPWLSMSCTDADFCAATTPDSVQFWDGDRWHTTLDDPNMQYTDPHGISCVSRDFCLVIDGEGDKYSYSDGVWSDPEPTLYHQQLSVSCYSTTFCEAVGEYGEQSFDGHYWSAVGGPGADGLYGAGAMDCYGEGTCKTVFGPIVFSSQPIASG